MFLRPSEHELHCLMVASLDGDGAAYRCLLEALTPLLRAYFRRRLHDDLSAHAEDLVQETLLALHARRMTFDPAFPFMAWVHAIARHKLIDFLRRSRRAVQVPLDDFAELLADPADGAALAGARLDVDALLSRLPERTRAVIAKTRLEGKSIAETSAETGLSVASVKVIVHRGILALRNQFGGKT
ncbi:sigma-70 family RNA polymerase sigma factor [Paracoccus binzhouensis]|uniref:sigma-70 family RNA polymerase sigma factor n=1 Tax=Paracoccus binzhouensis TaxID=2796149 RepID=UPI0018EF1978|nr:sigma-70 family RNA polymerase sigma factor [Paracoccus binzhouensis]